MKKIKWLTLIFSLVLVLIVIIANLGLGPKYFPFMYNIPGLDKAGHFFLMGILSYLVNRALNFKRIRIFSQEFLFGSLAVILAAALEEFSQIFLVFRAFSWLDLAFDLCGIILGGRLGSWLENKREEERPGCGSRSN